MVYHWSLRVLKPPQVSRTHLSILTDKKMLQFGYSPLALLFSNPSVPVPILL